MTNRRLHPAWIVLGARDALPAGLDGPARYLRRLHQADREPRSAGPAARCRSRPRISLLLLGATGPFAGRLADRWGPRRSSWSSLALLGIGGVAMAFVQSLWQLYLTAGMLMARRRGRRGAQHGLRRRRPVVPDASGHGDRLRRRRHVRRPAARHPARHLAHRSPRAGARASCGSASGLLVLVLPLAAWLVRNTPEERGAAAVRRHRSRADGRAGDGRAAGRPRLGQRGRADAAVLAARWARSSCAATRASA